MPPMHVRLQVAERQFLLHYPACMLLSFKTIRAQHGVPETITNQLKSILQALFEGGPCALDHDPALILRPYNPRIKDVASRYTPHAHDPAALAYREKLDHDRKTFGRKPGAERTVTTKGSDIWLKSKFNRLEGRTKKRPKQKIHSRGFQKRTKP